MNVVIVESPAKAKTINKYLGKDYVVIASYGHVRDLPSKDGSVKPDEDFSMLWEVESRGEKQLKEIASKLKGAESLILATDPDREGEAIAWHILDELARRKKLAGLKIKRVVFNEITKRAVLSAMENPREVDGQLVNAYLARRALDYLVGFTLSPVLWRKLPGSRSAGRVQSVALRLICERENEIETFLSREYWTVDADLKTTSSAILISRLTYLDGNKLDKFDLPNEDAAMTAKRKIEDKQRSYRVSRVARKRISRHPAPPFTTSTLQQEAARKLHFSARKTMQVAQQLYEGVDLGGETVGLITYMRTDGVQMAIEAINSARGLIERDYGKNYLPETPRFYKTKAKNAQEAHEAIRPTDLFRHPSQVAKILDKDQIRLYELIWNRTIASQMQNAEFDQLIVDAASDDNKIVLRSTGSVMVFDGFCKIYTEGNDDDDNEAEKKLPNVKEGEALILGVVKPEQHFTQPPPRYSEASLVKRLEELGIGRPSTYASILSVLQDRQYVKLDKRRFIPEDRGRIVTAFLEKYFSRYVQYNFTADLENELDEISDGKLEWKGVLGKFWHDFSAAISETKPLTITEIIDTLNAELAAHFFPAPADGSDPRQCPKCESGKLSIRIGKYGAFIGCSEYPTCSYTRPLSLDTEDGANKDGTEGGSASENMDKELGQDPTTGMNVVLRKGPYGFYVQLGEAEKKPEKKATKPKKGEPKEEKAAKPKRCSLPASFTSESITLDIALGLLALPRELGEHPETKEKISVAIGRFGPYIKCGTKFTSLPASENILEIGINRAVTIIAEKNKTKEPVLIGNHPEDGEPITLNEGRYGPYVKHGKTNASLPKNLKGKALSIEEALALLATKAKDGDSKGKGKSKKAPAKTKGKKTPAKTKGKKAE